MDGTFSKYFPLLLNLLTQRNVQGEDKGIIVKRSRGQMIRNSSIQIFEHHLRRVFWEDTSEESE